MKDEILGVVVLTYNQLEYLDDCLVSISRQDYSSIELIISDDCSPNFDKNKVCQILVKYSQRFLSTKVVSTSENGGITANINNALKHIKAEKVIFWMEMINF